jgi:VWFA-related protein
VAIEDNGLRVLHDYTQDTGALIAALRQAKSRLSSKNTVDTEALQFAPTDVGVTAQSSLDVNPYTGRPDVENMLEFAGERAYAQMKEGIAAQATLAAFQQIAEGVSGIPGRKSLVWITGSFPFSIDPATASVNTGLAFEAYQHTMRLLEQQMISVYPVDARGLLLTQPDASMRLSGSQIARASTLTADLSNRLLDTLETMRAFADMTGGRAYVNTNDTRSAVRDAVRDGSAYYILTYAADKSNVRPGWRQITVKSRDYHIRARRGYFMTQTTIDPSRMAGSDIAIALKSPFTYRGLPLKIVVSSPAGTEQQRKVMFSLLVPPKAASVDKEDRNHLHLDIGYAVWNRAGEDAGHKLVDYDLNLNPTQLQQIENQGVGYGDTLGLTPGSYRLRVVVRDDLTGKTGSVQAPLEVK